MTSKTDTNAGAPGGAKQQEQWAMGHASSHIRLWLCAVLGLAADLYTKYWAFRTLDAHEPRVLIENLCSLQLSLNPGALFGIGAGMAPLFVGASVLALLFVLYLFANSTRKQWLVHVALGLVLAGALGNLYDRTFKEAYVVRSSEGRHDIGVLVDRTHETVTLADFPDGAKNLRTYRIPTHPASGMQPVVRDFLKINAKIGGFELWPWIFNIADALLVIGVVILLPHFWADRKRHTADQTNATESAASGAAGG